MAGPLARSCPNYYRLQSQHARRRHAGPPRPQAQGRRGVNGCLWRSQYGCAPAAAQVATRACAWRPSDPTRQCANGSALDLLTLDHPAAAMLQLRYRRADRWVCGDRSSRGRPAAGAVSRRMRGDLHLWLPPWRHGWHVAPGPRQGRRGLGARWLFSIHCASQSCTGCLQYLRTSGVTSASYSGGAPGTRPTKSTSAGLWMGMTWPVSSKQRLAS